MRESGQPAEPRVTRPHPRRGPDATERVGHYRLEGELGRGGMGVVRRAFDQRLHRWVALKALPDELVGDREQLARLEREARALALVSHPNVAMIFGMEEATPTVYLVLELVEGETLRERLDRGPLTLGESLDLCGQAASGLAAVHAKGLVHRDLKASNIMVTPDGVAKLLDFGLARRVEAAPRDDVTRRGEVIGTAGWMSPEQLRGEELDARSDVWSWGCLLFECLAGAPAFPGSTWAERDAATLRGEPDWALLPCEEGESLRALLEDCLAKDRERRPNDLAELRSRLSPGDGSSSRARRLPPHSLPAQGDEFVGRDTDLRQLRECIDDGARMVNVLGLGGTGKTRLVVEFAREELARWPGGVWFCDLSEARSKEGISHAVAAGLGVPVAKSDAVAQLGHVIAGRGRCLVILDNFEQVARHARVTLDRWLGASTEAVFLVTSREVLGLPDELSLALAPLVPADASSLFIQRARRLGVAVSPEDRRFVDDLVELLDCLPLAVELAAARARILAPEQMLARMGDRFRLLASSGIRQDRQATLRATLDWSWDLLPEWEQAALAQCSAFEGGFTLEAAEAVLDLSAWPEAPWPMDVVQALAEKSLVRRVEHGRIDMLVTVQAYAAERLRTESGKVGGAAAEAAAFERHGLHFARFGTTEELALLQGHGGAELRRARALEIDNVVAACRRAVERRDARMAARALHAAWSLLHLIGSVQPLQGRLEEVLALDELACCDQALLLAMQSLVKWRAGAREESDRCIEDARELLSGCEGHEAEEETLRALKTTLIERGSFREALELALQGLRSATCHATQGRWLLDIGTLHSNIGDRQSAREALEDSIARLKASGNRLGEGAALSNLGDVAFQQRQLDEAQELQEAALVAHREVGARQNEAITCCKLGQTHAARGQFEEALSHHAAALAIGRDLGIPGLTAWVLGHAAAARAGLGLWDEAQRDFADGEARLRAVGDEFHLAELLALRARCELRRGDRAEARAHLAEADSLTGGRDLGPDSLLGGLLEAVRHELATRPEA